MAAPFANAGDVAIRLQRDLTAQQQAAANAFCADATSAIAEAAGKDDAWANDYDAPQLLKSLCAAVAARSMLNPQGLISKQEMLGQYSRNERYPDVAASGSVFLSMDEERLARRIINGTDATTVVMPSILDELPEWEDAAPYLLPPSSGDVEDL